jgi:hypothetical protein
VILEAFKPGTAPRRGASDAEETLSFGAGALGDGARRRNGDAQVEDDEPEDELGDLY